MRSRDLITINESKSVVSESYRMFRTNLNYMNVDTENQVILFTSSLSGEGKTTTIANTAVTFALDGYKTLIIEADLRKARLHEVFNITQSPGLTNMLTDKLAIKDLVQSIDEVDGLDVLTAGPLPPSPSELLGSKAIEEFIQEARKTYDKILIDAPPVLSVTDAVVLNRLVDGVVLVVASKETKKETVSQAQKALKRVDANVLGVLITKMDMKRRGYYDYYAYGYSYGDESPRKKRKKEKKRAKRVKALAKETRKAEKASEKIKTKDHKANVKAQKKAQKQERKSVAKL